MFPRSARPKCLGVDWYFQIFTHRLNTSKQDCYHRDICSGKRQITPSQAQNSLRSIRNYGEGSD